MKNLFIPYELAVIAKEKGFDKECIAEYYKHKLTFYRNVDEECVSKLEPEYDILSTYTNSNPNHFDKENTVSAPLYQQVIDWLFKEHGIWITLNYYTHSEPTDKLPDGFSFFITEYGHCIYGEKQSVEKGYFKTQYQALEKAIIESLEFIKTQ